MLGHMSPSAPDADRLADDAWKLRDIKDQCEWVLSNVVGIEARTLATLILGMINPDEDEGDDA